MVLETYHQLDLINENNGLAYVVFDIGSLALIVKVIDGVGGKTYHQLDLINESNGLAYVVFDIGSLAFIVKVI